MLEVGSNAVDFSLPDKDGTTVSLSDFRGQYVALYFYPKDNTSGCTLQAQRYRDLYPDFLKANAVVIGISKDSVKSHVGFAAKENLPFLILSDEEKKVIQAYGAWQEKSMYGRPFMGVVRSSFLIDPNGKIIFISFPAKPNDNAAEMLAEIRKDQQKNPE